MAPGDFFEGGTNTYNNWVEFSGGGFMTSGNRPEAQAMQQWNNGGFGGIQDLHLEGAAFTNTTLTLDGNSIYDSHDYDIKIRLERQQKWFLQFHADNFRTWSDDIGGFYPPTGIQYYGPGGNNVLALDRGEYSFLGGITLNKLPSITFQYTHRYRRGNEDSTIWGPVHPDLLNAPAESEGLIPSIYNIGETVDAFDVNAKKNIWNTDLALGLHYEHGDLNDGLSSSFYPGEGPPSEANRLMADQNAYNLFTADATAERWFKQHVFVSAGGMVANLDNRFSGNQSYSPGTFDGFGYYDMTGSSHLQEYVMDLNALTIPLKTLDVIPALRAERDTWDGNSTGIGTLGTFPTQPFNSRSSGNTIDVCESLDLRYTGITNWVFSLGGQWDEDNENVNQQGGFNQVIESGIPFGVPPATNSLDDNSLSQKYSAGASWYPLTRLAMDFGGYYKNDVYSYIAPANSTPDGDTYPGYFTVQGFETYDGNCRVTLHLLQNLALISRYEYQLSTIMTTPDAASGLGARQTSRMASHVIGQNISWEPWPRLSLNAGFTYVLSKTTTPASEDTAAILNAENNYWTLNFSPCFVVDDKTDLDLDYFYYQADDYQNNSPEGVPLGAGSREHAVTATLTRRVNPHLRVSLKYGYYNYEDALTGGNSNFAAHLIMATMQYRF